MIREWQVVKQNMRERKESVSGADPCRGLPGSNVFEMPFRSLSTNSGCYLCFLSVNEEEKD